MLQSLLFSSHHPLFGKHVFRRVRLYSGSQETYYDVLNLKRNCTAEEIRQAFIKLSKEFHPDVKGTKADPTATAKFVKISEAYQVLSKPARREVYDQDLHMYGGSRPRPPTSRGFKTEIHRPWEIKPDYDPNPSSYYGIKGLKRVSNGKILMFLLAFAVVGCGIGFYSASHSVTFNRNILDERSREAGEHHAAVRANAHKFGNEEQLKRMVERLSSKRN